MSNRQPVPLAEKAREALQELWVSAAAVETEAFESIPSDIRANIDIIIQGKVLTYRYMLLTQALAKATDLRLNALCLQAKSQRRGAFDARSLCTDVVVPFDRGNDSVLGGSGDPYVSKPARMPEISLKYRESQKHRDEFDRLVAALEFVERNKNEARTFLLCVLVAIRSRLERVQVIYPLPKRVSDTQCSAITFVFLAERSGGLRMQAVAVALFRIIGAKFNLFSIVSSANINASDVATGQVADIECKDENGAIALAVEVKDRQLTLVQMQEKIPAIRGKGISEFIFLVQGGAASEDAELIGAVSRKEFASGQNIYVCDFEQFLGVCMVLFGELGRHAYLRAIGEALDETRADIAHRRAWRDCLTSI